MVGITSYLIISNRFCLPTHLADFSTRTRSKGEDGSICHRLLSSVHIHPKEDACSQSFSPSTHAKTIYTPNLIQIADFLTPVGRCGCPLLSTIVADMHDDSRVYLKLGLYSRLVPARPPSRDIC
jgi:hypothetical protein